MKIKYFKVDGLDVVIRLVIEPDRVKITEWDGSKWATPKTNYSGIFVDEIPVDEIEEGGETWTRLKLQR